MIIKITVTEDGHDTNRIDDGGDIGGDVVNSCRVCAEFNETVVCMC